MVVVMIVIVVVIVIIPMVMVVMMILRLEPAHAGAECVAKFTISHVGARRVGTLPFHVVVVAFLNRPNFAFKPEHLRAVFAQDACWRRDRTKSRMAAIFCADLVGLAVFQGQNLTAIATDPAVGWRRIAVLFHDPFGDSFEHFGVIAQIARLYELDIRVFGGNLVSKAINPVNQDAGK